MPNPFAPQPAKLFRLLKKEETDPICTKAQPKRMKAAGKNICRYISRQVIQSFANRKYRLEVLGFCDHNKALYESAVAFFERQTEQVSGWQYFKTLLVPRAVDPLASEK